MRFIKLFAGFLSLSLCIAAQAFCAPEADAMRAKILPTIKSFTIDLKKDCGAKGDGATNDLAALQKASQLLQASGGGTLTIPAGIYVINPQYHENGKTPYYQCRTMLSLNNLDGVRINGMTGAVLRMSSGLHFGSFDPVSGNRYDPPGTPQIFANPEYRAELNLMIEIRNCRNVIIEGIELDGNNAGQVYGGRYGDMGIQIAAYGMRIYGSSRGMVLVENVYIHHHCLDGLYIGSKASVDTLAPIVVSKVVCEYNDRQGFSWTGGNGLTVVDSKFSLTGRGVHSSSPAAGLDIEAETGICRNGYFRNCEFVNNVGCGMVSESGDGGYTRFDNCLFIGTTNWSVWPNKPGIVFYSCRIYNAIVNPFQSKDKPELATRFIKCTIRDTLYPGSGELMGNYVLEFNSGSNIVLDSCNIRAEHIRSMWFRATDDLTMGYLHNSTVTHAFQGIADKGFIAVLSRVHLQNVQFKEEYPTGYANKYYLNSYSADGAFIGSNVTVQGPVVSWWGWKTGALTPNARDTTLGNVPPVGTKPGEPRPVVRGSHARRNNAAPALCRVIAGFSSGSRMSTEQQHVVYDLKGQQVLRQSSTGSRKAMGVYIVKTRGD